MDPVVTGAAIGLAGAAVGAVGAYLGVIWNTGKTIKHEREQRVWERRADAYLEALKAVEYLLVTRGVAADWNPPMLEDFLHTHTTPDWEMLEARMQAFASEGVLEWMQVVYKVYKVLPALDPQAPTPEASDSDVLAKAIQFHVEAAVQPAVDTLTDLIREELQDRERHMTRDQRRRQRFISRESRRERVESNLAAIAIGKLEALVS
jgi:hypothetical protein